MAKAGRAAVIAGAAIAAGVGAGLVASVKSAVDFEREMRNVNSIAKLGEKQFKQLGKSVTGMAAEVGQKPKVLASGLYDIVSSGFKASDAIKVLRVSAKAATAGMTDTATASKAVTAALNAYHQGAGRARQVSDVLFQTVNKGVLTFEELSQQMGDLVPASAPLGVSLEEVGASMATLTLQGVPAAEAATRVKSAMIQLAKPSKGLSALLKENGFASGEAAIKAKGFSGVLQLLSDATHGSVSETAKLTPEIRSLLGVVGLTGKNLKTYEENLRAMKTAQQGAGITASVFAEQSKSVAVQWQKFNAAIDVVKIQIGSALLPALSSALGAVSGFLAKFNEAEGAGAKFRVLFDGLKAGAGAASTALLNAFKAIDWGVLAKAIADAVQKAVQAVDWGGIGKKIKAGMDTAAARADIPGWSVTFGQKVQTGLTRLSEAVNRADWQKVGAAMVKGFALAFAAVTVFLAQAVPRVALGALKLLASVLRAQVMIGVGAGKAIGEAVIRGIVAGLEGVAGKVTAKLDAARAAVVRAAGAVYGNALGIGKAIVQGILNGIGGLYSALKSKLESTLHSVLSKLSPFSSVEHGGEVYIGKPLADGAVGGFLRNMSTAGSRMGSGVAASVSGITAVIKKLQGQLDAMAERQSALDRSRAVRDAGEALAEAQRSSAAAIAEARKKGEGVAEATRQGHQSIRAAEESLAAARQAIVTASLERRLTTEQEHATKITDAMSALVAARSAKVEAAFARVGEMAGRAFDAQTQKYIDSVSAKFDRMIAQVRASADMLTPAEAALAALDKAEAERQRSQALSSAQASGDPEAIRQAQLAIQRAQLEEQARIERAGQEAQAAEQIKALEATKARDLQNLTERRNQQRIALDGFLADLKEKLLEHPKAFTKTHNEILALLKAYRINYRKSGANLGIEFAHGLDEAQDEVRRAAKSLAEIPRQYMEAKSPTEKGPMSTLDKWWNKVGATLVSGLDTGAITKALGSMAVPNLTPSLALGAAPVAAGVGLPGVGGGGTTIQLVLDGRVISEIVRKDLIAIGRRNGSALGGLA